MIRGLWGCIGVSGAKVSDNIRLNVKPRRSPKS